MGMECVFVVRVMLYVLLLMSVLLSASTFRAFNTYSLTFGIVVYIVLL